MEMFFFSKTVLFFQKKNLKQNLFLRSRGSCIPTFFDGFKFNVYTGRSYSLIKIISSMVFTKIGCYSFSKKRTSIIHSKNALQKKRQKKKVIKI